MNIDYVIHNLNSIQIPKTKMKRDLLVAELNFTFFVCCIFFRINAQIVKTKLATVS